MLRPIYLLNKVYRKLFYRLGAMEKLVSRASPLPLVREVRRCLLLRGVTCLMTGVNRTQRYFTLPKKPQKLSGQLVPQLPIIVTLPYLILRPPSRPTFRTIPIKEGPFRPPPWHLLRNLRGLLTEIFIS